MTLHEAMRTVLQGNPERAASTQHLSDEIWLRQHYRQRRGTPVHAGQIRIRAINHPKLFVMVDPTTVRLVEDEAPTRPSR